MKKTFFLVTFFLYFLGYSQFENTKEVPFYAEKTDFGYRLFRFSLEESLPIVYLLKNGEIILDKKYYDDLLFEETYPHLEKITASKEKQLISAFFDNGNLYEIYNQKREIKDFNNQTIEIYLIEKNKIKLVESFDTFRESSKSKFAKYIFIK